MTRVKEIEDKKKAPKLDKSASKRFVRSALWQAAQKKGKSLTTLWNLFKDAGTNANIKKGRQLRIFSTPRIYQTRI